MSMKAPRVGVSAVVLAAGHVLLVKRARPPLARRWAFPGGRLELGERLEAALRRELREECHLEVELLERLALIEAIQRDAEASEAGFHWIIVTYLARPAAGSAPGHLPPVQAGDDALELRWVRPEQLGGLETVEGLTELTATAMQRLAALEAAGDQPPSPASG